MFLEFIFRLLNNFMPLRLLNNFMPLAQTFNGYTENLGDCSGYESNLTIALAMAF